jgi:adenylate cyclase
MKQEIERKFMVKGNDYRYLGTKNFIVQGYLCTDENRVVRVRISGNSATLTIKGKNTGVARNEFEYPIPVDDAKILLELCIKPLIEKYRYTVHYEGMIWEVDEFMGENHGLVIAEIELKSKNQEFKKPEWVGDEVTSDPRFFNVSLVHFPYKINEK